MPGKLLLWSPRILGVMVCLFLSIFALDAFESGKTFQQALPDFAIHITPMLVLLVVVLISWRWAWVGGVVFTSLAAVYVYFARNHISWILVIALPLLLVGILFLWSWFHQRRLRAKA